MVMEKIIRKRPKVDFREEDVMLAVEVLNKARDVYGFFKYLKEKKDSPFAMVLIKSDTLKESILKEKRESDVFVDLGISYMTLIFLPITNKEESDGFIRRMMSGIKEKSGDFASIVEVKKNADLEETVFELFVDYLMLLKQPLEWRTGQISYHEV